jgi:SAM-dependent methyltransferase
MQSLDVNVELDWQMWFERWETMQNCYVPQRLRRFDLMLQLIDLPRDAPVQVLDLGCGPGSLAFYALRYYPKAHVVAVDFDPVLLAIGHKVANRRGANVHFARADLRQIEWWVDYERAFDLVLSSTMLHWLSADNLLKLYERIYRALKPGGWFMNSDHMAIDDPVIQDRYRELLNMNRQSAFSTANALDWNSFWEHMERDFAGTGLAVQRDEEALWEGSEDGLSREFHLAALRQCGFKHVEFHWLDLGDAIVGARRME